MRKKLFTIGASAGVLMASCAPPTYQRVKVDLISPFPGMLPNIIVTEKEGQRDIYFLPDKAIIDCKIEQGSTVMVQTAASSPEGIANDLASKVGRHSGRVDSFMASITMDSAKPMTRRIVTDIFGCEHQEPNW